MSKVNFRTNILIKSIIGKDLIIDDNLAVLELIKNSFDAGSKKVDLIFKDVLVEEDPKIYKNYNSSKIIIRDFGKGMTKYDLENKWLNIAYSEKKEKKEEYGRTLAGNKGVGRFSCDRLGKFLVIYTRRKNKSILKLAIDWRLFEVQNNIDLNIQDIELELIEISDVQFKKETGYEAFQQGTFLEISSLREIWDYHKILSLKRQIERLVNPNQSFSSDAFDIIIEAKDFLDFEVNFEEFQKINGPVKNQIFEKLNFKVTYIQSKISANGKHIITILKDRGNTIFTLVENNKFNLLKNIKVHIYYLNPYSKAYFKRQTGIRTRDFGSIFLFINGFRIPPYGDDGDDWLGMENRKHQGRSRFLGAREVIGRIEVKDDTLSINSKDDDDDQFQIISNRSGVVNNKIFNQLTKSDSPFGYYYKTFRRLERFVVEGIKWDSVPDFKRVEKEVSEPGWDESKERYTEDSLTRNKRLLSVIGSIIDLKKGEITRLNINQNFINELIEEQSNKVQNEIDSIVNDINDRELDSKQVLSIIDKLKKSENEIDNFPVNGSPEIQNVKDELETRLKELTSLSEKLMIEAEENRRLAEELELEKQKNTYFRTSSRSLSEDAKGLVHNIKITSKKISDTVDNIYSSIISKKSRESDILKALGGIKFQSEKALKISRIITRSNFNSEKTSQIVDVVNYIRQYIALYADIFSNSLKFEIIDNEASLTRKISVLEISVIMDDLISNSEKANAKRIQIEFSNPSENELKIIFSDDGNGVPEQFLKNPSAIFELGITTTTGGSGIGLHSVKTGLKSLNGNIYFIGNGKKLRGASFEILLR